jgi:hypothetical protein
MWCYSILRGATCAVSVSVVFWAAEVVVGERGAFQVTLGAPSRGADAAGVLPVDMVEVVFADGRGLVVRHGGEEVRGVRKIEVGDIGVGEEGGVVEAWLKWGGPGDVVVLCGAVSTGVSGVIKVSLSPFLCVVVRARGVGLGVFWRAQFRLCWLYDLTATPLGVENCGDAKGEWVGGGGSI